MSGSKQCSQTNLWKQKLKILQENTTILINKLKLFTKSLENIMVFLKQLANRLNIKHTLYYSYKKYCGINLAIVQVNLRTSDIRK